MSYSTVTSGAYSFAIDLIDSVSYPREKIAWGVEGTATEVTMAAGFPVQPATSTTWVVANDGTFAVQVSNTVTVIGTVAATQSGTWTEANSAAIAASLSVMDDWDETNRAAVNTIAGQVGVQGASGAVTALTQRVVLATDVALPTGTNAIGKLAANSGVDIGDVDVTSLPSVTSGTTTQVASSATNVTLKASNAARTGLSVFNDSTQILYLKLGATATSTSYMVKMAAGSYWELPLGRALYTGIVDGIWASANGNAYVTEW